jgi:copper chaperone NosL
MKRLLDSTRSFFETPLGLHSRVLIFVAALMVIPTFFFPLWQMTLTSNQFPEGLELEIY